MTLQKIDPRGFILLMIMVVVAILRIITHFSTHLDPVSNFTPIGAMALFGGAYFSGKIKPFFFPLLTLFISDLILSFTVYSDYRSGLLYTGWYWTYAAFALMVLAGKTIIGNVSVKNVLASVLIVTLIHWLVSDIGGCLNEKSAEAAFTLYQQRLITAIPYEWRFLAGTILYTSLMFGSFEWLGRKFPNLKPAV